MSRKKKTSPAEDIVELVSLLPWWLALALAALAYFFLHSYAVAPDVALVAAPGAIGQGAIAAMKKQLASIGQYLIPALCLVGAVISALRRRARARLRMEVSNAEGTDGLKSMTWHEFERVVGEAFRLDGYKVAETGGAGPDGGVDLILTRNNEKFLVQCKQWRALKVGVTVIRELYGVMAAEGVAGGFVVTCGYFTEEAKAFASGRNLTLLDGPAIATMLRQHSAPISAAATHVASAPAGLAVLCPICTKAMVERTAKRGAHAGKTFWGCVSYPACKGTAPKA